LTEIALRTEHHNGLALHQQTAPPTPTIASLVEWAQELTAAASLAESLCRTPFVPTHFRGKPADTAAAILTGFELGLSPMAAVRAIFVISGTPGMYAKSMVAVVQSRGHEVWIPEQTDARVVVRGRRRGSEHVFETVWDRARVEKAKLTTNAKYQENPQQMMVARGQAEICRQVAADALHGIPYAVEEMDGQPDWSPAPAARVTAAEILAGPPPAAEPEPERQPENVAVEMMTQPQQRKLFPLLKERGYADKDAALALIAIVVGREIKSRNELTKDEARRVIDHLDTLPILNPEVPAEDPS
jgi:hypothetical protein